jgi:ATP-binding cassette, subfamily B, bacterial
MKGSFAFYRQMDQMDCGSTCLRMITRFHGRILTAETLREKCTTTREGSSFAGIAEGAEALGINSLAVQVDFNALRNEVPLPCVAHWRQRHFVVVRAVRGDKVDVADPAFGLITYPREQFISGWQHGRLRDDDKGLLLLLEPTPEFYANGSDEAGARSGIGFLLPYFRPYRPLFMQLTLGLLVGSSLQLLIPFLTQAMVDHGIEYQNLGFIYLILLGQLTVFFSQTAVGVIRGWLLLHIGARINIALISNFLIKLMRLPMAFFDSKSTGDLLLRVQDHNRIEALLSSSTLTVMFSVVNLAVFGLVLAYYDLRIFGLFLGGTALYVLWVRLFMKQRAVLEYKRFDQTASNQSSMIQLIHGMQEIKLNNSERRRRWEWEAIQVRLFRIALKGMALIQWQTSGATFINELKNILITFVAARAVINGEMTLGMMLAVQYIIGQLNAPINNFIGFVQSLQDARISLDRLAEIHACDDEENRNEETLTVLPASRALTIAGGLGFRYGGAHSPLVLDNINLEIPEGKVTAIVGASGSGKTTLLKLLLRFYKPSTGVIRLGNTNLDNISARVWRARCGAVMQNGYIFADTIARNITESNSEGEINRGRLLDAVRVANIEEFIESLPLGYNTRLSSAGVALSGGQSQRILIARAVYKDPDFLFFDEATSALDAGNERVIMENLARFCRGRTVVVIAHRLSTVRNADQIIVLDHGRVVEQGQHEELTRSRGAYFTLVKNQLELGTE